MNLRIPMALVAAMLLCVGAFAADEAASPYTDLNKQVQEKLKALGFYDGPVNGDFGFHTQAALARFQLSIPLPASGSLDHETLDALGIEQGTASAGSTQRPEFGGRCDALVGQERERCLKQGGTVEANEKPALDPRSENVVRP
jgi:peptidoglycan hydrolase-like protein with peptidoglycan-binding domain